MLKPGSRIGPYEIVDLLGAGGMGEVYRARDTSLNRDVALKVLPEAVAADPDRYARFTREAQTLAALNHPLIAHVHGLESSAGVRALVMELVEGEDLAERIGRGPLPIDEALPIARQIADALEAAHEQGIVHRDLKPANIKLRPDGTIKILDFGLAKAMAPDEGSAAATASLTHSPTLTLAATQAGVILGTASYMSPEQARGRAVDRRTDIWAFGCVVYEMLTGRRAFNGEDVTEIAAAVLKEEPGWDNVPPEALRLIRKCLQKDPKQRLRDIGDAWELIDRPDRSPLASQAPPHNRSLRPAVAWGATGLALAALATLAVVHFSERPPVPEPVRFQIHPPESTTIVSSSVSPDGRQVAFTARGADGRILLWVRSLETLEARPLEVESGPGSLFWSPDSRWIGLAAQRRLWKVDVSGGSAQRLCDLPGGGNFRGAAWSRSGVIILGTSATGLMQVSENGGTPSPLVAFDPQGPQDYLGYPTVLPDDRHFLYQHFSDSSEVSGTYLGSLDVAPDQQDSTRLLTSDSPAAYAAGDQGTGHLMFRRGESLMAQVFDANRLALIGEAMHIAEGMSTSPLQPLHSVSSTGTLVYKERVATASSQLIWHDRQGKALGPLGQPGDYADIQLSPDGKKVIVDMPSSSSGSLLHVWTADVARGIFSRLNPGETVDMAPAVSPDGRVAFSFSPTGVNGDIFVISTSGVGAPEAWVKSRNTNHPNHFSLDGRFLIYDVHGDSGGRQDLWILPTTGDRTPIPFLTTPADETFGQFSPDGKWIAYSSDESGRRDVYVQGFDPDRVPAAAVGKWPISTAGGDKPRWRRDGHELYYMAPDGKMMAVPVKSGATFEPGVAVPLFDTHATGFFPYDVSPDGRFLINTLSEALTLSSSTVTVVLNWQAGLKK